jgi:hypothetical protein
MLTYHLPAKSAYFFKKINELFPKKAVEWSFRLLVGHQIGDIVNYSGLEALSLQDRNYAI